MMSPGQFLAYGAIGVGLALALLAYRLLSKEMDMTVPRPVVIRAIYVFMAFALVLASAGFVSEYLTKTDVQLQTELAKLKQERNSLRDRFRTTCDYIRTTPHLDANPPARKGLSDLCG